MNRLDIYILFGSSQQHTKCLLIAYLTIALFSFQGVTFAEGTKQLEAQSAPLNSVCKIVLSRNISDNRIPFALLNCNEEYRLNIRISDYTTEKIYFGFGNIIDYFDESIIYTDLSYQVKDPAGNIVTGYSHSSIPNTSGWAGFIETREEAEIGPDINNSNPQGYKPLVINPSMNGDYIFEFDLPNILQTEMRVFSLIDVTVAKGNTPVTGRLWSKAWQLSTSSVNANEHESYSVFYIYSSDSIVTSFDCNGLAGGVWTIYSNEWGCATSGTWSDRRHSIAGNASVQPQYKIFLNDPDPSIFPSGNIGEMNGFVALPYECDTVITFMANVSKGGNIEILLDVPPLNPNSFGPEDVQLGYNVVAGPNILLPAWNGKNAYGIPLANGTQLEARISFLNGLSNIPLYDVEDNPKGFKVDIRRPMPVSGATKLKLYWDDTWLPSANNNASNVTLGCEYSGLEPVSGCHEWSYMSSSLGEINTVNSWWYYSSGDAMIIPITLKLSPPSGHISGPVNICAGQLVTFRTTAIPFAQKYIWHLSGPGVSIDIEKSAPDTTFVQQFALSMPQGQYTISVFGRNPQCGDGESVTHTSLVYADQPPPVSGTSSVCLNTTNQYQVFGSYSGINWSVQNGDIIGSSDVNPVTIRWHATGKDTIRALATSVDCGTRLSTLSIEVHPVADAGFATIGNATSCPGLPLSFSDTSFVESGSLIRRYWDWGNNHFHDGNDTQVTYSFPGTGTFTVLLKVTTDYGCETEASRQIRIIPYPDASFSCYRNCLSQSVQLTDISTGIDLSLWDWDFGTAPVSTANLNMQHPEAVFHSTGIFPIRLVVTNQYGCRDTVIQKLTIHNPPIAAFGFETPCQRAGINFSDQSTPADTILTQFTWNVKSGSGEERTFHGNPSLIDFADAANYHVSLIAMDAFGCIDTAVSIITVKPKPDCSFEYIENIGNVMGKLQFENQTSGASEFYWDFGNSMTSTLPNPDIKYNLEGEYTIALIATSTDGCTDTATRQYYYLPGFWLPNAFTPDNDGLNDIFRPVTQRNTLKPFLFLIYDRWGQMIFKSTNPEEGWDGKSQGSPCQVGNYTYMVQFREGMTESSGTVTQRGVVSLIR